MDYAAPILRIVRSMSLEDDIRMLVSQAGSVEQLLQAVKGTRIAAYVSSVRSVDDVEEAVRAFHLSMLEKLSFLYSIVPSTFNAYSMLIVAGRLASLIKASVKGEEPPRALPRHPLLRRVSRTLAEAGIRAVRPILIEAGFTNLASYIASAKLEPALIDLYLDLDLANMFGRALIEVGDSRGGEHVCFRLDAIAVRLAGNAALIGTRNVRRLATRSLKTCKLDDGKLREAVEEATIERIGAAIHATPYQAHMSPRLPVAEAAYHAIRKLSRKKLQGSLAHDPTEPGFAAAVLELLELDAEDVTALAIAAFAGLPREVVSDVVSLAG